MRVLVAPQELKGTLTAVEAAEAIAGALQVALPDWSFDRLPMADGGPGTAAALQAALGGTTRPARAHDPLMRPIEASWTLLSTGAGVIELAEASGLWRLRPDELDARRASTFGTGELVREALDAGCRDFLIGLGGSATNDGGAGMAQALGYRLLNAAGSDLSPGGAALSGLRRIDASQVHPALRGSRFVAPTDVTNPLCGPAGASAVFGPQKGADVAAIAELDAALEHFAAVIETDLGLDVRSLPGAGAAGGSGAGVVAFLGAEIKSGAEAVAVATSLAQRIAGSEFVITGEGRLDGQTDFGKGPQYVARLARAAGKPVVCVAGSLGAGYERLLPWFDVIDSAAGETPAGLPDPATAARQIGEVALRAVLRLLGGSRGLVRD